MCCRFFYFFMVWPTLWVTVSFLTDRLFGFVEWWFYREVRVCPQSLQKSLHPGYCATLQ